MDNWGNFYWSQYALNTDKHTAGANKRKAESQGVCGNANKRKAESVSVSTNKRKAESQNICAESQPINKKKR